MMVDAFEEKWRAFVSGPLQVKLVASRLRTARALACGAPGAAPPIPAAHVQFLGARAFLWALSRKHVRTRSSLTHANDTSACHASR